MKPGSDQSHDGRTWVCSILWPPRPQNMHLKIESLEFFFFFFFTLSWTKCTDKQISGLRPHVFALHARSYMYVQTRRDFCGRSQKLRGGADPSSSDHNLSLVLLYCGWWKGKLEECVQRHVCIPCVHLDIFFKYIFTKYLCFNFWKTPDFEFAY